MCSHQLRFNTPETLTTLQLAGRVASFPSIRSVTLTARSITLGFFSAMLTDFDTTSSPVRRMGMMQPSERMLSEGNG
eukprot:4629307-Prymnesium_polylepis.1